MTCITPQPVARYELARGLRNGAQTNLNSLRRARVLAGMTAEPSRARPLTPRIVPPAKRCSPSPLLRCCSQCARSCVSPRVPRSCARCSSGPLAVGDLASHPWPQQVGHEPAPARLARRRRRGRSRRGRAVIYSLAQTPMVDAVVQMLERAASSLSRLGSRARTTPRSPAARTARGRSRTDVSVLRCK